MSIKRQELFCHNCNNYVQFDLDLSLEGNHILSCPVCQHEHCRVVKDGKVTDIRWDNRNGQTYWISTESITYTSNSTFNTYTNNSTMTADSGLFLYKSWMNTTTASN